MLSFSLFLVCSLFYLGFPSTMQPSKHICETDWEQNICGSSIQWTLVDVGWAFWIQLVRCEFDLGSFTASRSTHMGLQKPLELTHKLYLYGLWMLYTKFFNYWTTFFFFFFFFFFQFRERTILKEKKKKKKKKAYGILLLAINGQLFQEKRAWELVYTLVANLCYA